MGNALFVDFWRRDPAFYRDRDYYWSNRERERDFHDYWRVPPYWVSLKGSSNLGTWKPPESFDPFLVDAPATTAPASPMIVENASSTASVRAFARNFG